MTVVKLWDALGTRYINNDQAYLVNDFLSKLEEGTVVDLAHCKFGPNSAHTLSKYYGKVKMCNSIDERLNLILEHNQVSVNKKVQVEYITSKFEEEDVLDIIRDLKSNYDGKTVYELRGPNDSDGVPITIPPKKMHAVITLLTITRPEVKLRVGNELNNVFMFARNGWLKSPKSHSKYWEVIGNSALIEVDCNKSKITTLDGEQISEEIYIRTHTVMPYEFGTVRLFDSDEFSVLIEDTLKFIRGKRQEEVKKMKDVVRVIERK